MSITPTTISTTLFYVPALERLSYLSISVTDGEHGIFLLMLDAAGDDIAFTVNCYPSLIVKTWKGFTEYAGPTIRDVRLENPDYLNNLYHNRSSGMFSLLMDAHTLEIDNAFTSILPDFWDDLKEGGPQLKTTRFEVLEDMEPLQQSGGDQESETLEGTVLDRIEELVVYRFKHGRPFSSVERMIVSGVSEEVNQQQESLWRRFYNDRRLYQYLQPE